MKAVPFYKNILTNDTHFWISEEDYDMVIRYKWTARNSVKLSYRPTPHYRISRCALKEEKENGYPIEITLHRFIFGLKKEDKDVIVDHKNELLGWLDNTRETGLRLTTRTGNARFKKRKNRLNGFPKGVHKSNSKINPFRSMITINDKNIHLGCFPTTELAHEAYKQAAVKYFGEFARFE